MNYYMTAQLFLLALLLPFQEIHNVYVLFNLKVDEKFK